MGARSEALAREFEAKAQEAARVFQELTDADWGKKTSAEGWSVGVTAHHIASNHELVANIVGTIAAGSPLPHFTLDMLHEMNAKHAREHAGATRAETIAFHERAARAAAAVVRGLSDDQLGRSASMLAGMPPMTAEEIIARILIHHVEDHLGSIRTTVGG
jgi:hypothetical protein